MSPKTNRPDPLLPVTPAETAELAAHRGRLKIFLGYAAGVGKTYAMLEAAQLRKDEGIDLVIGTVDSHQRLETEALLDGLEAVPLKTIVSRGISLTEMDIDSILSRHPELVIVDELAHTNAPGSRHPKRHQDVDELLTAGIDVYTTLNIQHLESLKDVVAKITGIQVRETVPDSVIDDANELELVDLPPDELLDRLRDGKVYIPEQAQRAIDQFFRKGNLTALREITLRRAAERIDDQMRDYMRSREIDGPWAATERVVVCVSPSPLGERLIRSARRLSEELKADWVAVYVETPSHSSLSNGQRDQIHRTMQLADKLGARTKIIPAGSSAKSIAQAILDYARQQNATKIVVGKPIRSRWLSGLRGSMVNEMIYHSGGIDIHVVTSSEQDDLRQEISILNLHSSLSRYLGAVGLVILTTLFGFLIELDISPTNLVMLYLLTVVIAALYLGRGPSILASILGVLAFDFFFVPPTMTLTVDDTEYLITFAGLLSVGLLISALTARAREQAESARRREADTAVLYALSRDLAAAEHLQSVIQAIEMHITPDFGQEAAIYLPEGNSLRPYTGKDEQITTTPEADLSLAMWAYQHGEVAGFGTDTLPTAEAVHLPLKTSQRTVGVLAVKPKQAESRMQVEQRRMLEAFASLAAQAIERVNLVETTRQIELLQTAEKLQSALLNSISHDLRTPLVSITGALTTLEQNEDSLDPGTRMNLVVTAREEADRLNRLVGNLLDMTRLEAGVLKLKREPCDVQDLIGVAIGQMENRLEGHNVRVDLPATLPLIELDFVLIVHTISNILDNALKYSPVGSPIDIQAELFSSEIHIRVLDRGIGIPESDLNRIFDKFYRVQRTDHVAGTGLGLAICKGIIEAHGGRIWATNWENGGTMITFVLPA